MYLSEVEMVKKYVLKIYYNTDTEEIIRLSEQFSDCDEYKLMVDDEEITIPEEMQECLSKVNSDEIGVS